MTNLTNFFGLNPNGFLVPNQGAAPPAPQAPNGPPPAYGGPMPTQAMSGPPPAPMSGFGQPTMGPGHQMLLDHLQSQFGPGQFGQQSLPPGGLGLLQHMLSNPLSGPPGTSFNPTGFTPAPYNQQGVQVSNNNGLPNNGLPATNLPVPGTNNPQGNY